LTVNDLQLDEDDKTLKAVTVVARKPFIEQALDKTIVNVENSIVSAGSTALEVLEKAPNVIVDNDGRISLLGKQGVRIMIDGKPSQLSNDQLVNLLRNMNANQIQRIEIITNPSAKYDAAGNAGIINIVMKKNQLYGTNGQISSTYGQGVYYKSFNSLNINYREGKWNLFGGYNYNNRKNFNENNIRRIFRDNNGLGAVTDSFVQTAYQRSPRVSHSWRAGVDYSLSQKTTVGVLFNGSHGGVLKRGNYGTDNFTKIYSAKGEITEHLQTLVKPDDGWNEWAGNANLKHTFDSTGREITLDVDYYKYGNFDNQDFEITILNKPNMPVRNQLNQIRGDFDIKSAKFDYTHPLSKKTKFELGGKTSFVKSDNDIQFFNIQNGVRVVDTAITNNFIYEENINALYANWMQDVKGGISYQIGLRMENTNIKGNQVTQNKVFDRHYTNFFPTAFVQKKWGKKDMHTVKASYSRRIDRPSYQDLNPFRSFLDQYTFQQGNINLTPQYSHNVELTYVLMGQASLGVNYSKTEDVIAFVLKQDDAQKQTFITNENLATKTTYGISLNTPIPIRKWWFANVSANYFVNRFQGPFLGANLDLKIPALNLNINNRFSLPKDFSAEVSAWYVSRISQGLFIGNPMGAVNAGISKSLMKNRLTLRLNAQDIFWSQRFRGEQRYQNLDVTVWGLNDTRQVRFTASYRFGNQKVQQARRRDGSANDEKNRIQKNG
jgi:hypothetical protein